jgi:hypothetical protein
MKDSRAYVFFFSDQSITISLSISVYFVCSKSGKLDGSDFSFDSLFGVELIGWLVDVSDN